MFYRQQETPTTFGSFAFLQAPKHATLSGCYIFIVEITFNLFFHQYNLKPRCYQQPSGERTSTLYYLSSFGQFNVHLSLSMILLIDYQLHGVVTTIPHFLTAFQGLPLCFIPDMILHKHSRTPVNIHAQHRPTMQPLPFITSTLLRRFSIGLLFHRVLAPSEAITSTTHSVTSATGQLYQLLQR